MRIELSFAGCPTIDEGFDVRETGASPGHPARSIRCNPTVTDGGVAPRRKKARAPDAHYRARHSRTFSNQTEQANSVGRTMAFPSATWDREKASVKRLQTSSYLP